jgi:hypothetical protein
LCLYLGDFIGVVVAVEKGEPLQVCWGPGVLALEQLVDFALGGGAVVDCGCVVFLCFANMGTSYTEAGFCRRRRIAMLVGFQNVV